MKKAVPNPLLTHEHGLHTYKAIAEMGHRNTVFDIKLDDGDSVSISGEVAIGVLTIYLALNEINKAKMETMDFLSILYIYDKAIEDGILTPSRIKGVACPR